MCRIYIICYKRGGAGRGEWGEAIPETAPNPSRVLKKFSKPVPNPVIKIDPRPIRGGAGRVLEKTRPIAIPNCHPYSKLQTFPKNKHTPKFGKAFEDPPKLVKIYRSRYIYIYIHPPS